VFFLMPSLKQPLLSYGTSSLADDGLRRETWRQEASRGGTHARSHASTFGPLPTVAASTTLLFLYLVLAVTLHSHTSSSMAANMPSAAPGPQMESERLSEGSRLQAAEAKASSPPFPSSSSSSSSKLFVWFADLHADPYYGSAGQQCSKIDPSTTASHSHGIIGCDPPATLMESAISAAADILAKRDIQPTFVLNTGDIVRHAEDQMPSPADNISDIVKNVAAMHSRGFPHLGPEEFVLVPMGNTDTPQAYGLEVDNNEPKNAWLTRLASSFVDAGTLPSSSELEQSYSYGGYCRFEVGGLTVLSLNTVIYSVKHTPRTDPLPEDPFQQFMWLRGQLAAAAAENRKVWIVGHIPLGLEVPGYEDKFIQNWHTEYADRYRKLVSDKVLGSCIAAQLFGHVHANEFRMIPGSPPDAGPILLSGALSPIYGNYPSFHIVEYNATSGALLNMELYWTDLPATGEMKWQFGYDFVGTFPSIASASAKGAVLQKDFAEIHQDFLSPFLGKAPSRSLQLYAEWYKTKMPSHMQQCVDRVANHMKDFWEQDDFKCLRIFACGITSMTKIEHDACSSSDRVQF